tara:strand:+ start:188 stop:697 length:510 start_codon:yes stop_codon:yes gene_type:complete
LVSSGGEPVELAFFLIFNYHLIDKTCSAKMFLQVDTIMNSIKFNYLSENKAMYEGKIQLTRIWVYEAEHAHKMEENIAAHTKWMQETHYREGDKALRVLNWSSAPEMKDEVETGNITFVLTEVYETMAGVDDHFQQAQNSLSMPHDMSEGLVSLTICDRGNIKHSLWKD